VHEKKRLVLVSASSISATDLPAMQIVNRERCWLLCFVLDRSFSAQVISLLFSLDVFDSS
jgi:hypothetical protein